VMMNKWLANTRGVFAGYGVVISIVDIMYHIYAYIHTHTHGILLSGCFILLLPDIAL
jgi:hypothetical protein